MTVEEMESRMSSKEFSDWMEFFKWRAHYSDPESRPGD